MAIPYVKNPTWVDGAGGGTSIDAADLNNLEQGVYDSHRMPCARVYHSANQSIATATPTVLAFNSERFDTDTMHDNVTNNSRLTCKTAGKYQITAQVQWDVHATGYREIRLRVNGSAYISLVAALPITTVTFVHQVTTLYDLAVNDYVEAWVNHTAGVNINVLSANPFAPEFMMVRVST